MKQIFINLTHWLYDDEQRMFPISEKKEFHAYLDDMLEKGYMVTCIRILEV